MHQIGAWHKPTRPAPTTGNVRITFIDADGLYFGEGSIGILFNDPMAGPVLTLATMLLKYITDKSIATNK
ncbi:MAG TPA: hypothetical protein PKD90_02375 [Phnomibacter sp.]|nr:hypothetical protein [Phnomibacter sp.]